MLTVSASDAQAIFAGANDIDRNSKAFGVDLDLAFAANH